MTSTQEELIRYRIQKRMAGRRDILLHALVYALVLALVLIAVPWWDAISRFLFAILWAVPLLLQFWRYYLQNGAGARKRAAEIEAEVDRQSALSALDEEEEYLVEDRLSRKANARGFVVAHFLVMAPVLAVLWIQHAAVPTRWYVPDYLIYQTLAWLAIFALHWLRHYFVHGKTNGGRALKIERELERQWHMSRQRIRQRRQMLERGDDEDALVTARVASASQKLMISDEGELLFDEGDGAYSNGRRVELGSDL
ncbi:MAG: hypothetical protein OXN94_07390 [Chloroflexota bacterium]|nr:hypothetical protein [Chloroflexota bacterium]